MVRRYSVEDEEFYRNLVLPQEDLSAGLSVKWDGSYRWFRSTNVVCIEHYKLPPPKLQTVKVA